MKRLALLVLLALGCTEPATQVLVVVHSYGLKIGPGGDVDGLRIVVKNDSNAPDDNAPFNKDNPLCGDLSQPACWTLPVTATLVPGPDRPNDLVVVKVLGLRNGAQVIGDQASFRFLHNVSQRLDFVLWANCLDVDCTMLDKACNYAGMCQSLEPTTVNGQPQLDGLPPYLLPDLQGSTDLAGADLTTRPDLATPPDLAGADLTPPSDLSAPSGSDMTMLADMRHPDLSMPDLSRADLSYPDLSRSDMSTSDMSTSDMESSDMSTDDMSTSDMESADMATSLWNPVGPSPANNLLAVWGFGPNVFVVGTGGIALHSPDNGAHWSTDPPFTAQDLHAVWGDPAGDVIFAAGNNGVIFQRQVSGSWTPSTNPWTAPIADLRGLWGDLPGEFAVVGKGFTFGTWNGSNWTELCGTHDNVDSYHAIAGTTQHTLLVAGVSSGVGQVSGIQQAVCMAALGGGDDMACTPGCPLQPIFTGGPALNGISAFGIGSGYAVGAMGTILSCANPGGCTPMPTTPKAELWGVWSEPDGMRNFAVGDAGLIENLSPSISSSWMVENSNVANRLNGVWGLIGGPVYAVGDQGTILKRN
jgi:hypothetical protein